MAFNMSALLTFATKGFDTAMANASQSMNKFKSNMNNVRTQAKNMGQGLFNIGLAGTAAAAGVGYAIKEHADLERQLKSVAAKMTDGVERFADLENAAKAQGRMTIFTAKEAAQGLEYLALAGFASSDAIGVLPTILKTAGAGQLDLGRASDIVTDSMSAMLPVMKVYGDKTKQAIVLADMMTLAQARTNTNIDQLGEAIKYGGGALSNLGIPLNEIIGSMGALANAGLKGSIGGTSLLNMFNKIADPSEKALNILSEMGVTMDDLKMPNGKLRSMTEIVNVFNKAIEKNPDVLGRAGAASEIFGIRGQRAFFALKNAGTDTMNSLFKELSRSSDGIGEASRQYGMITDSMYGMQKALVSALDSVVLEFGKMFSQMGGFKELGAQVTEPIIKFGYALSAINTPIEKWDAAQKEVMKSPFGDFVYGIVDGFNAVKGAVSSVLTFITNIGKAMYGTGVSMKTVGKVVSTLAIGLVAVGPVLLGLGLSILFLTPVVTAVGAAFSMFGSILALLASPITLVIAGLAAAGYVVYKFMGGIEGMTKSVTTFYEGFMSSFEPVIAIVKESLMPVFTDLKQTFVGLFDQIFGGSTKAGFDLTSFGKIVGYVAYGIVRALTPVVRILGKILNYIGKIVSYGVGKFKALLDVIGLGGTELPANNIGDVTATAAEQVTPTATDDTAIVNEQKNNIVELAKFRDQKNKESLDNFASAQVVSAKNVETKKSAIKEQKVQEHVNKMAVAEMTGAQKVEYMKAENRKKLMPVEQQLANNRVKNAQAQDATLARNRAILAEKNKGVVLGQGESKVQQMLAENKKALGPRPEMGQGESKVQQMLAENRKALGPRPQTGQGESRVQEMMAENRKKIGQKPELGQGESKVQQMLAESRKRLSEKQMSELNKPVGETPVSIADEKNAKGLTPAAEANKENLAMTSTKSAGRSVNVNNVNNIPQPVVEVNIKTSVDENGINSMVKKSQRHEKNKAGTQLKSAGLEGQSQVAYGS